MKELTPEQLERLYVDSNADLRQRNIPPISKEELVAGRRLSFRLSWVFLAGAVVAAGLLVFVLTQVPWNRVCCSFGRLFS